MGFLRRIFSTGKGEKADASDRAIPGLRPATREDRDCLIGLLEQQVKFTALAYLCVTGDRQVELAQEPQELERLYSAVLIPKNELRHLDSFVDKPSTWLAVPTDKGIILGITFSDMPVGHNGMSFAFLRSSAREEMWLRAVCLCQRVTVVSQACVDSAAFAVENSLTVACSFDFVIELAGMLDSW